MDCRECCRVAHELGTPCQRPREALQEGASFLGTSEDEQLDLKGTGIVNGERKWKRLLFFQIQCKRLAVLIEESARNGARSRDLRVRCSDGDESKCKLMTAE